MAREKGASGPSGGSTLVSKYAYGNDGLARRTYAIRSGLAFAATHQDAWGYNDRNELTTTRRFNDPNVGGTTNADPNLNRDFQYDAIGNRVTSAEGTGSPWSYARNSVNQYPAVDTPELGARYLFDPDGNLSELLASADINLDGNIDQDDVDMVLFCYGMNVDDPNCGMSPEERQRADISGNGVIDQDDLDAVLFYFGATVSDTLNALLAWDGENRLVKWTPRSPRNGSKKCEFKYDFMGRRVEKKVYTYGGSSWSLTTTRRYVWRDWLRLMELDGSNNVLRRWTWGRDLSGLMGGMGVSPVDGAGGIGGLLSVHDANETPGDPNDDFKYVYFYDANGNVGQVVDLAVGDPNNTIKAKYEYDAYGNVTSSGGTYASANAVRFSTKPWDDETGMGDWGRRYFDPRLGRWISRDPIDELASQGMMDDDIPDTLVRDDSSLYAAFRNCPASRWDVLGLANDCERCWAIAHPGCAAHAYENTEQTRKAIRKRYGGKADRDNTVFNAIKHCVWMCKVASVCGCDAAAGLGDCHENDGSNDDISKQMDLANNVVGRQCAGCTGSYGASGSPPKTSWGSCFSCCEQAAVSGRLKWFDPWCPPFKGDLNGRGARFCQLLRGARATPGLGPVSRLPQW